LSQDLIRDGAAQHVAGNVPAENIDNRHYENGGQERKGSNQ